MGQRSSRARTDFAGVLPNASTAAQPTRSVNAKAQTSPDGVIPVFHPPPHALLSGSKGQRETPLPLPTERREPIESTLASPSETSRYDVPESVRKSQTIAGFENVCSEILPGFLFVSNLHVASDRSHLANIGITHVVNCCREIQCFDASDTGGESRTFLQLTLRDGVQEDLLPFFPVVLEFIEQSRQERADARVLIHCHQGISRSCAFAIAYVMYHKHQSFQEAMALVKARRPICSPNTAFLCQLMEFGQELRLCADVAVIDHSPTVHAGGLYRLTPHAAYDPHTLLLKLCYQRDSRRPVEPNNGTPSPPGTWFWSGGIFVFANEDLATGTRITIWKGAACAIPDAVGLAKERIQQWLRVHYGPDISIPIDIVEQSAVGPDDVDHFGYAIELAWSAQAAPDQYIDASRDVKRFETGGSEVTEASDTTKKPKLFLFQTPGDTLEWEHITNYDSGDLTSEHAFLLVGVESTSSWLWVGSKCRHDEEQIAQRAKVRTSSAVNIARDGIESDEFWEMFEAGY